MFSELLSACKTGSFGGSLPSNYKSPFNFLSLKNWSCRNRPTRVDKNCNENLFYQFTISVNKCHRSWTAIDDPYAWVGVPNKVNETRFLVHHESCKYICGLKESLWKKKKKSSHDECQCECKELDDWCSCKDDCIGNPSTCNCQ